PFTNERALFREMQNPQLPAGVQHRLRLDRLDAHNCRHGSMGLGPDEATPCRDAIYLPDTILVLTEIVPQFLGRLALRLLVGEAVEVRGGAAMVADAAGVALEAAQHPVALVVQPRLFLLVVLSIDVAVLKLPQDVMGHVAAAGV